MLLFTAVATLGTCLGTDSTKVNSAADSASAPANVAQALPFKLSGSADVYYRYNLQNPRQIPYNNLTSFTNSHNSFELGMVSLKAEHTIGKVGFVADVGLGKRAEEFSYDDSNTRFAIKQLYVSYAPTEKIKFTMGSWATHVGYELVDAYLNRNYSMSYLFSYGPFFHTGLKAEYSLGNKSALMVGVTNPTDLKTASRMPKMSIAQFSTGTQDDKIKAYFNYQGGKFNDTLRLYQGDVVLTYAISSKLSLTYDGTMQSRQGKIETKWAGLNKWWGSALYVNYDPAPWVGLTLRTEYINDKKSLLGFDGKMYETTLSSTFKIDDLIIIPEFRVDTGSKSPGLFIKDSGAPVKSTESFLLAAIYHF